MNILDQLAEYSRLRVAEDKKKISLEEMENIAIQTKNEKLYLKKHSNLQFPHLKKHSKRMA